MKLKQSLILSGVTSLLNLGAWGMTADSGDPVMHLPQFVVTATMSEQPMRLAPASVSMIGLQELQETTSASLLEVMRETTGLSLVGQGVGGRKVLLLRGMEARHSLILVDGRRISATDAIVGHSDFQYDWVPLSAIERIEVVRGPMSALYGSEAMGGVVNIITRPVPENWGGELSLSVGLREDGRGGRRVCLLCTSGRALE
ncbi:MAG: TonB-dependent receptor plug domain-containing protein [Verrucomicrobia bacterium]|nr:TonB-dependent receptor plug domain-containing protein [Verrucomicrobiota bacterium]